jgi:phospholipid/cholesterol/gamma-HCH transport system substrate-binding protein
VQLNAVLVDARESLKKVDAVLADAQKISASTKAATEDLASLRAEVEASLRRVSLLIEDINRRWPFGRDTEMKLP